MCELGERCITTASRHSTLSSTLGNEYLEIYRSIPLDSFRISGAKTKQWEGLVKRRRDHHESDAFLPAHKTIRVFKSFGEVIDPPTRSHSLHSKLGLPFIDQRYHHGFLNARHWPAT